MAQIMCALLRCHYIFYYSFRHKIEFICLYVYALFSGNFHFFLAKIKTLFYFSEFCDCDTVIWGYMAAFLLSESCWQQNSGASVPAAVCSQNISLNI